MNKLYASVTNTSNIFSIVTTANHDSPVASATVEAYTTSLTLGDAVTVDLGYSDNHSVILTGYVKQIERTVPDDVYVISIYDKLVRAQDYFIASTNPQSPLSYQNIAAETLISNLMSLAGLTVNSDPTYFTFGVQNKFEINLITVFDYCRMISDLLTWSFWCDSNGNIQFKNRKPYVMRDQSPENLQPGFVADTPTAYTLVPTKYMNTSYITSEKNLRNRVVVYGSENVYAEATAVSSVLPEGFYKSAVLAAPQLIADNETAQDVADYNLDLLNRVTEQISATVEGDPDLRARTVVKVTDSRFGFNEKQMYVYGCDMQWNSNGFTTALDLRDMA
jgi:hypothetical protein